MSLSIIIPCHNEEEIIEEPQRPKNNSNKSIFSTIGETLGLTAPTTQQNNSISIQTNMKKVKCEGQDCDIFSEDVMTAEINSKNLGSNFNKPENRFNNARNKIKKLMGEQITILKKNNKSISNIPLEGDIIEYKET